MKLKLDLHGIVFEYEKKPLPESRFRLLCALAAVALYVGAAITVTVLCGFLGLLVMVAAALVILVGVAIGNA